MQNNSAQDQTEVSARKEFAGLPASSIMHQLITHSQKLIDLGDKESQALVQNDMLAFAILQYEKEALTTKYVAVSEEFRSRLEEFRHIEKPLLARLEKLQKDLAEKSHANNAVIRQIQLRAEKSTQKTLLEAQEMAQGLLIRYDHDIQQKQGV
jgi:hypothetical protein